MVKLVDWIKVNNRWVVVAGLIGLGLIETWPFWFVEDSENVFSAPLIPAIAGAMSWLGVEYTRVIVWAISLSLVLMPIGWMMFAESLAKSRRVGLITGMVMVLPSKLMVGGRIDSVYEWGDGAHIVALAVFPMLGTWWLKFLKYGSFKYGLLASIVMALIALTSPFGVVSAIMMMLIILFSEMLLGKGRLKLARVGFVLMLSGGLLAWWYHPEFLQRAMQSDQGRDFMQTVGNLIPISFVVVPMLATVGFLIFEKRAELQPLFIAIFLTLLFLTVAFARNASDKEWFVPFRYYPELSCGLGLLMGVGLDWLYKNLSSYYLDDPRFGWLKKTYGYRKWLAGGMVGVWVIIYVVGLPRLWAKLENVGKSSMVVQLEENYMKERSMSREIGYGQVAGYVITMLTVVGVVGLGRVMSPAKQDHN